MANGAIKITYTFYSKIEKRYYNLTWFLVLFVNCTLVQILATETNIWYVITYGHSYLLIPAAFHVIEQASTKHCVFAWPEESEFPSTTIPSLIT